MKNNKLKGASQMPGMGNFGTGQHPANKRAAKQMKRRPGKARRQSVAGPMNYMGGY